jgi:hypothetical protein
MVATNEITDSPAATFTTGQAQNVGQGLSYGEDGDYTVVPAADRFIDVTRSGDGTRIGASYINLAGLEGRAGIFVASGFADPAANGDGPGFSTFLVLDDGTTIQSDQNIVSTEDDAPELPGAVRLRGNYPNPFHNETHLVLDLPRASEVSVSIVDATGRLVRQPSMTTLPAGAGQSIRVSAGNLPAGLYLYRVSVTAGSSSSELHGRMMLVK